MERHAPTASPTRIRSIALAPALIAALAAGCLDPVVGGHCDPGYALANGACIPTSSDADAHPDASAAVSDAGSDVAPAWTPDTVVTADASVTDASVTDASVTDASVTDGAAPDTVTGDAALDAGADAPAASSDGGTALDAPDLALDAGADTGAPDTAAPDTGAPDGGALDTGAPDGGSPDVVAMDAGDLDGSAADAGAPDETDDDAGATDTSPADTASCGTRALCADGCVDLTRDGHNCGACDNVCTDGSACSDGVCVTHCPAPTVACFGRCVDLSSDSDSCGACGAFCPTGICNGGVCRVGRVGHLALIGHDYTAGRVDQNRLVGNAVFLSSHVPVRVVALGTYAAAPAALNVDAAIRQVAGTRAWERRNVDDYASLGVELTVDRTDVLLVYAQTAATDDQLGAVARAIAAPVVGFVRAGGVVIVLDGMGTNSGTFPIANGTGLIAIDSIASVTGQILDVNGPVDALAVGLPAGYRAERSSVAFHMASSDPATTADPLTGVLAEAGTVVGTADSPVVVHRVLLPPRH